MAENHEVVLRRTPQGIPVATDFQIVSRPGPSTAPHDGLLVRVIALSLDPYLGARMRGRHMGQPAPAPGAALPGSALAQVLHSKNADFTAGDYVVAETGWTRFAAIPATGARKVDPHLPLTSHL